MKNPLEKYLKRISRYHYWVYSLIFLSMIPMIMHILKLIFISPPMDFQCDGIKGAGLNYCPCEQPVWDTSVFEETMQTKFGLHCDRTWLIHLSHSICYTGTLFGSILFGFISDKFGRLNAYSLSCLTIALFGSLVAVMPTFTAFSLMHFFEGAGVGGCIVTSYVLVIEYCGLKNREVITALYHIPLNVGHVILPGISYFQRNMDDLQLTISIPMFLFVASKWMIMESPKWLMDNGFIDVLAQGLQKITAFSEEEIMSDIGKYEASQDQKKIKAWHIFKHKKLMKNFCSMAVIYFTCGIGYYGVSQYIGSMAGNIHLNVAVSGLVLIPGTILCIFILKAFSRRHIMMTSLFLSGLFIIVVVLIPRTQAWWRLPFACVGNCFFFICFIVAFLYGVELFPTSVRNSVLGVLCLMSRIGLILAPQINSLSEIMSGSIFGTMAILSAFLCLLLPETKNSELPTSLEETLNIKSVKGETVVTPTEVSTSD